MRLRNTIRIALLAAAATVSGPALACTGSAADPVHCINDSQAINGFGAFFRSNLSRPSSVRHPSVKSMHLGVNPEEVSDRPTTRLLPIPRRPRSTRTGKRTIRNRVAMTNSDPRNRVDRADPATLDRIANRYGGPQFGVDAGGQPVMQAPPQTVRTFVLPHVLEKSGRIDESRFTFDSSFFASNEEALGSVPGVGPGQTVDVFLFDNNTGAPLQSPTGREICSPCSLAVTDGGRKPAVSINEIADASGGLPSPLVTGFAVIVVKGDDAASANLQGFVVNSHTGPFDLSVFGFAPEGLQAPAQ